MKTSDFDYHLPEELIAQTPVEPRDSSRMMVCNRNNERREDHIFRELPQFLRPGDVMVLNETRVIPARLLGVKESTGVPTEVLLLRRLDKNTWDTLVKPGRRLHQGDTVSFGDGLLRAEIMDTTDAGGRVVRFIYEGVFESLLDKLGEMPLPPYIHEKLDDPTRYQTVYARLDGSAAAPTAGLHFTPELIERLRAKGIEWHTVELEVGLDTFRIVDEDDPEKHTIHTEVYTVPQETVDACDAAHARGTRVIAVGTTSVRSLESAYDRELGRLRARNREATSLYILPGYTFGVVDALVTNFHVPRSTLMMLVSAFSTRENIMAAYKHAIESDYRLLSFGDAMFIR